MFNEIFIAGAFLISLFCGLSIIPKIVDFCRKRNLYDQPDARKRHKTLIPRLGGVCFLPCMSISFMVAVLALYFIEGKTAGISLPSVCLAIGVMVVYVVGVIDDVVGVEANKKLVVQIASACFIPLSGLYINNLYGFLGIGEIPCYVGVPLTVFLVVYIDNAMNLVDGIDGLCSGLSIIALAGFALMFAEIEFWVSCVMIAGLIGVLLSYSYFNIFGKRHKIFMGDSGSLTLGFLLSVFLLKLSMNNPQIAYYDGHRMIMAASFLVVPCFDVVRVVMVRMRQRKPLFAPDRNHIHHKLVDAGCPPRAALCIILGLSLCFVALNGLLTHFDVSVNWILLLDIATYTLFHCVVRWIPWRQTV